MKNNNTGHKTLYTIINLVLKKFDTDAPFLVKQTYLRMKIIRRSGCILTMTFLWSPWMRPNRGALIGRQK